MSKFTHIAWLAIVASLVCAAALAWYLVIGRPARLHQDAVNAKAGESFGNSRAQAGQDAVGVVVDNRAKTDAIQTRVEESENAVRKADPAGRDAAALRELCKSPSTSLWPECSVFRSAQGNQAR